ncbi:TPA: DUF2541 family protein [Photobacterium damselae]|uniref:DUF2541 domain-containing protein n=5 Tax=Photobacterium damselae TaxID=38293 RepID=D0Z2P1_PHODD|nr:DUF2541 family protein [Photobacterium damselae]ARR50927.1 DUF2541 domain-containing protein [Photobacterium damselae subsp. damselae]AWK83636.1 DUF2541 domain-containing protein [Photobacterium damselae]EEZ39672.1 hypothetical protein VDA_000692 [Photobacterium damselae subsp. damselae CIP 102761]EHA1080444.1 DUF2541 family protein [Photobacterium damselae]ELI6448053.1 DUF2541 family protein [Photobacterium damselae]
MTFKKFFTQLLVGVSLLGSATLAHADDQFTLGRTILLEHGNLAAKIPVPACRYTNAIKVKAERDVRLRKVVVHFQNGEKQTIKFYRDLDKNEKTAWRYFGFRRCVTSLDVYGNSERTTGGIRVYGRKKD